MEETTITTAAPTQVGVESSITRLLDKVIDQMFSSKTSWSRKTLEKGTVGSVSHAKDNQLKATEGEILSIVSYTDGSRTFYPSVEVRTQYGVCLANIQGVLELEKGQKVELTKSFYMNKENKKVECLDVTKVKE